MAETFLTLLITGDLHSNSCGFVTADIVLMIFTTSLHTFLSLSDTLLYVLTCFVGIEMLPVPKTSSASYYMKYLSAYRSNV